MKYHYASCSTCYTVLQIKNCLMKSTSAIHAYRKKKWHHAPQLYQLSSKSEVSITIHIDYVQPVTQQYESITVQKAPIATMKNTDDFHYKGKPSCATAKSTLYAVSKDEWDTKEDTGKSMKNALYVLRYAKGTCRSEAKSNSDKIKPVALAIIELRHQPVSRKFY